MRRVTAGLVAVTAMVWASPAHAQGSGSAAGTAEFFELRVRPLFAKNCFACHTSSQLGGLRLDSRETVLKGGNSGPAIVPGRPEQSLLMQAVRQTHARLKMPPQGKLPEEAITDLAAWILAGAVWPDPPPSVAAPSQPGGEYVITPEQRSFWAFQPVREPPVPEVKDSGWPKNAIDRFILARLEKNALRPVKATDKRVLLRRITYDLIGLPPTPEELDAWVQDTSPDALAKVVDRLLASPHYGERWGRYWLDLARYADGQLGASKDTPYPNSFRYRDWVIQAFNEDMPYHRFVKAQIAADLLPDKDREKLGAGLGFQALGGRGDDQVDVTTRVFLGLTVACAQCHDHKYDPIPTQDYYSLLGIFKSSEISEIPLAPPPVVQAYKGQKKQIDDLAGAIDDYITKHSTELGNILATKTSRYMVAAWKVLSGREPNLAQAAAADGVDAEILDRWTEYLKEPARDHPYLQSWHERMARGSGKPTLEEVEKLTGEFQDLVLAIFAEKKAIDDRNYVALGGAKGVKDERTRQYTNLESLEIRKYYLWRDLASEPYMRNGIIFRGGLYYYGLTSTLKRDFETRGGEFPEPKPLDRFLHGEWVDHLRRMREQLAELERTFPPLYPFLHALRDAEKPANAKIAIRGDPENPGEDAPRRFLRILCDGKAPLFTPGSGRLQLAEAIASPSNPLTARVLVNRIWQWHFGRGLVPSPSNFGQLGERPSHPELLDYLASRFVNNGWSMKALHREILLSATYQLSSEESEENFAKDPENRLLWRYNLRSRLDAEALRDSLLAVAGRLDRTMFGPPAPLTDDNRRRAVYGYIGRTKLDPMLLLFDFPNANSTSEQRTITLGPVQRLFFLNNSFVAQEAKALADRLHAGATSGSDDAEKIRQAYRLLFGRAPTNEEIQLGLEFLQRSSRAWSQYAQVLLSSSEFSAVN